jgi:hypothetical protein
MFRRLFFLLRPRPFARPLRRHRRRLIRRRLL